MKLTVVPLVIGALGTVTKWTGTDVADVRFRPYGSYYKFAF